MASRAEQKERARAQRVAAEEAERRATGRRSSLIRLGLVLGLAVVVVIVAVIVSSGNNGGTTTGHTTAGDGRAATQQFAGLPQHGLDLGSPKAKATLVEFADLQCPFCREYNDGILPTVISRYVRTGKVRYELRMRSFLGNDSVRAAGAAAVAAQENRLYPFADLFYHRQQTENTGYVTDGFIKSVASAVGVNPTKAAQAADDPKSEPLVAAAEREAATLGSSGTPDFFLRLESGRFVPVQIQSLTPGAVTAAIDQALKQS
jgi:protein-disulfide isomerase